MFALSQPNPEHLQALARVAALTRAQFGLEEHAVVFVSELTCTNPGCPPLETVVVFWNTAGVRHRFKIFKVVRDVSAADIPYKWLLRSLAQPEGFDADCC